MIESFTGLMLLIGSGILGREVLLKEQASLRVSLHHLEAYRDAVGIILMCLTLAGLYHSISTGLGHRYTPIYWCFWTLSNGIGFMIGIAISIELWSKFLMIKTPKIYQIGVKLTETTLMMVSMYCWSGLTLGTWRFVHPWLG